MNHVSSEVAGIQPVDSDVKVTSEAHDKGEEGKPTNEACREILTTPAAPLSVPQSTVAPTVSVCCVYCICVSM